jgi:Phosphotransferase enzyme family
MTFTTQVSQLGLLGDVARLGGLRRIGLAVTQPLTPSHILDIARGVAHRTGLDAGDAEQIKFTNNAVVRLPRAGAVIRIPGSPAIEQNITTNIMAATVFAAHGVRAVESFPGLTQPVRVRGRQCTIWKDASDDAGEPPRPHQLASILRRLHTISGPQPFPDWQPMGFLRRRLAAADGVSASDLRFLRAQCDLMEDALSDLQDIGPLVEPGLIHGDAFLGNLIAARGGPVICDFDATSIGPREWDLTPIAVGALRMDYDPAIQAEFVATYGVDVTQWAGFPILRRLRELQLVMSVLPALSVNPRLRPQWQHRLATLQRGDTTTRWTPFALSA